MAAYAPNDAPTQLSLNTHTQEAWVTSSPTPTTRDYAPCSMLQEMAVLSLVKYGAAKNICLGLKAPYLLGHTEFFVVGDGKTLKISAWRYRAKKGLVLPDPIWKQSLTHHSATVPQ